MKVHEIIEQVNYQPDVLASMLATKKSFRFAVLIPTAQDDSVFWKSPLTGVKKAIDEMSHYGIEAEYFLFKQYDPVSFYEQAEKAIDMNPEGIVIAPVQYDQSIEFIKKIKEKKIPFVFINSNIEDLEYLSYIGQDSVQSGYLAARLLSFGLPKHSDILVVNIAKQLANQKHILKRNIGFKNYFEDHQDTRAHIYTLNIENIDQKNVNRELSGELKKIPNVHGIFVSSSRVFKVAQFLNLKRRRIRLVGYDLIEANIPFLQNGTIDFLISQKPIDQGYYGIIALINHLVLRKEFKKEFFLPIDIITKENIKYYDY